ncbi:hypothetical protein [Cupriavidus necator]|uniref:hypothetical protein n=1 Tax=Cupriavidus necator TaxID=106590 RepID=UPI002782A790|nr:hypothetical protein [Cupriavidus necator]MDQ0142887.1 uncharacterized SAM-binding protein YcdF (DUF218 family) [Cupriavidus necator]
MREDIAAISGSVLRGHRSINLQHYLVLEEQGVVATAPIVVMTSDFHVRRAVQIAGKAGFGKVAGVGAGTPIYLRYNAWLREYFAAISE